MTKMGTRVYSSGFKFRRPLPDYMKFREDLTTADIQKSVKRGAIRLDALRFIDRIKKQEKFSKSDIDEISTLMKLFNEVGDTEYFQFVLDQIIAERQKNV